MQMALTRRLIWLGSAIACLLRTTALPAQGSIPATLAPASTPAQQIFDLSIFVVAITGGIFLVVGARFLTNGQLIVEKTGLGRARAMAQ